MTLIDFERWLRQQSAPAVGTKIVIRLDGKTVGEARIISGRK